jgi:hypothetical protein
MSHSELPREKLTDKTAASGLNLEDVQSTTPLDKVLRDDNDENIIESQVHLDQHSEPSGEKCGEQKERTRAEELHEKETTGNFERNNEHTLQTDDNEKKAILGGYLARKSRISKKTSTRVTSDQSANTAKTLKGIQDASHLHQAVRPKVCEITLILLSSSFLA